MNLYRQCLRKSRGRSHWSTVKPCQRMLSKLLLAYPIRRSLLQHLSAYDVAKLDAALGGVLEDNERDEYLNPGRDLFWYHSEIVDLMGKQLSILLFGRDVPLLEQRLHDPEAYHKTYGRKRRLQIYLVGACPLYNTTRETLMQMLKLSVAKDPNKLRIWMDRYELRRLRQEHNGHELQDTKNFLLAFAAPRDLPFQLDEGGWYLVPAVPDPFIDLRVYVPSFRDRLYEVVDLPHRDLFRVAVGSSHARVLLAILETLRLCAGKGCLSGLHLLTSSGIAPRSIRPTGSSVLLNLGPYFSSVEILY